jgi:hypothetical protein
MRKTRSTVVVLALVLAGCAPEPSVQQPAHRDGGNPEVHATWQSCASAQHPPAANPTETRWLAPLDVSFAPVAIVLCTTEPPTAGGQDIVATERRAGDIAAVASALRLPDEPYSAVSCPTGEAVVPWFALLDAQGRWVHPGVPIGDCGEPVAQFSEAFAALHLETVATRKIGKATAVAAAAARCELTWADMIAVAARSAPPTSIITYGLPSASPVRLCVYGVPAGEQGSPRPGGVFVTGTGLTEEQWGPIASLLPEDAPAKACTKPAGRFALVRLGDNEDIYVELDGCHRLLSRAGGNILSQASGPLITALEGVCERLRATPPYMCT